MLVKLKILGDVSECALKDNFLRAGNIPAFFYYYKNIVRISVYKLTKSYLKLVKNNNIFSFSFMFVDISLLNVIIKKVS